MSAAAFPTAEEFFKLRKALEDIAANRCRWGYDPNAPWKLRCPNCRSTAIRPRKRHTTGKRWRCDYCKQEFDNPIDLTDGLSPLTLGAEQTPSAQREAP